MTGHLSVIYTIECQINFVLRLIDPILKTQQSSRSLTLRNPATSAVDVKASAAKQHSTWLQGKLSSLVWASGCTSWFLDPKTGLNIAMYPEYQFIFWLRSIFPRGKDFEYVDSKTRKRESRVIGGWKSVQRAFSVGLITTLLTVGTMKMQHRTVDDVYRMAVGAADSVAMHGRRLLKA